MFHIRYKLRRSRDEDELVWECYAFLTGRYAQYLENEGLPVPPWAWLNTLAHGAREEISAQARRALHVRSWTVAQCSWQQAVAYLAREMMTLVDQNEYALLEIQQSSLVPLELQMTSTHSWTWEPREVVLAVLDALDQFRATHRQ